MKKWIRSLIKYVLKSLRVRLFVLILIVGIIPAYLMYSSILSSYETRVVSVRTSDVSNQLKIIANHLITYNYLQDSSSEVIDAELNQLTNLYDGRVLVINSGLKVVRDTYGISQGRIIISEEVVRCIKDQASSSNYDKRNGYIEITTPIILSTVGEDDEPEDIAVGALLTSVSTDNIIQTQDILTRRAMLVEVLTIVLIIALAFLLSTLLVKPFVKLTGAIGRIPDGEPGEPIMVGDYLETERVCDAFNRLQSRARALDDSRKEFVSNVSHELKTPITSVKILADSLVQQEDVPVELYREFMEDITKEIDRENQIINDLLALVKMDKTAAELTVTQLDINELVEKVLKRLRPIARKQNVELVLESIRPVTAAVDEVKMSQIISNLVENAIKYNRENGWVKVTIDADHQFFTITVADSGIGIPEDSVEHIFERFYRVDKSHSREIGGTGLGLAIARGAVLLHHGSIRLESKMDEGTTFYVKIPLTYISA